MDRNGHAAKAVNGLGTDSHRILVCATGSIGVLFIQNYVLGLIADGKTQVKLLLSAAAARFVRPDPLRLFCDEVLVADRPSNPFGWVLDCTQWADQTVVLPASANTVALAAAGSAATDVGFAILQASVPVVFFPNMEENLWTKPVVRRNVALLRGDGHVVVEPVEQQLFVAKERRVRAGLGMPPPGVAAKEVARAAGRLRTTTTTSERR